MDIAQLYQEGILTFAREARSCPPLETPHYTATLKNLTCGDRVQIDLDLDEKNCISAMGAKISGCALCEAGAGLFFQVSLGKHRDELALIFNKMSEWLKRDHDDLLISSQDVFIPVRDFTARHQCVLLPFETATKAISNP